MTLKWPTKKISSRGQPFCWKRRHCSRSTLRFPKVGDKKGACLREMPQESFEIFDFRLGILASEDWGTHHQLHCTRSTLRTTSRKVYYHQKGACLREMPQESSEIYTLQLVRVGVPYKWIAPSVEAVIDDLTFARGVNVSMVTPSFTNQRCRVTL